VALLCRGIFCLLITKAYAENTVDVSFSAEMIPAACRVSLDNGGTVDYGTLSLSSIRSSSPYLLTPCYRLAYTVREPATGGMDGQ
jgi:type 1 fimbria pilin